MRLYYGGHPNIYGKLKDRTGVPERLRILRPDATSDTTVTLRLKSIANIDANTYSLESYRLVSPKTEPYRTLQRLGDAPSAALDEHNEAARQNRDAAAAAGKGFDAELDFLVGSVSTGDADSAWAQKMADLLRADSDAARLSGALGAKSEEQLQIALATLTDLRKKSTSKYAYVLDVFGANHQSKLKNTAEAERLFLAALGSDPYLTGAWFDLGKLYYASFRTREAWACWDMARSLSPTHLFGKDVDNVERRITSDLPQFFYSRQ